MARLSSRSFLQHAVLRVRRLGIRGIAYALAHRARGAIWSAESLVIFRIQPAQVRPVTAPVDEASPWSYRNVSVPELLHRSRADLPAPLARELSDAGIERRVHMIELGGRIVSWGFSAVPRGSWPLYETRSSLEVEAGAACLVAFETLPAYRGRRFYTTILSRILEERFADGVPACYIWCSPTNAASYAAIMRVGFRKVAVHRHLRILGFAGRSARRLVG
jgi:RimJ/RimL family protein N-acetyltransferase